MVDGRREPHSVSLKVLRCAFPATSIRVRHSPIPPPLLRAGLGFLGHL